MTRSSANYKDYGLTSTTPVLMSSLKMSVILEAEEEEEEDERVGDTKDTYNVNGMCPCSKSQGFLVKNPRRSKSARKIRNVNKRKT